MSTEGPLSYLADDQFDALLSHYGLWSEDQGVNWQLANSDELSPEASQDKFKKAIQDQAQAQQPGQGQQGGGGQGGGPVSVPTPRQAPQKILPPDVPSAEIVQGQSIDNQKGIAMPQRAAAAQPAQQHINQLSEINATGNWQDQAKYDPNRNQYSTPDARIQATNNFLIDLNNWGSMSDAQRKNYDAPKQPEGGLFFQNPISGDISHINDIDFSQFMPSPQGNPSAAPPKPSEMTWHQREFGTEVQEEEHTTGVPGY